ncbi:helix-turn-helix domain-containing protein [Euzebya pacifica]|jgi:transcriptional regulator with XRE-family HTH domain|uniref:helix-turn-helix domain-containing protein n=1 Tax=Euzebya pacifica TaxID=1608957 RepID=UPI0030FA52A2
MDQNSEQLTPGSVVGRNVRRLRERRGLSLADLGTRAGVSKTTVHDLEGGTANPRLETLYAIATALSVGLADLLTPPEEDVPSWVVRADEGPMVHGEAVDARLVGRIEVEGHIEVYDFAAAHGLQRSRGHAGHVRECLLVHDGTVRIGPDSTAVDLAVGDAILFTAGGDHVYGSPDEAGGRGTLLVIHTRD